MNRYSSSAWALVSILEVELEGGRPVLSTKRQIAGVRLQEDAQRRSRMQTCVKPH